jgi:hypothetical protein
MITTVLRRCRAGGDKGSGRRGRSLRFPLRSNRTSIESA